MDVSGTMEQRLEVSTLLPTHCFNWMILKVPPLSVPIINVKRLKIGRASEFRKTPFFTTLYSNKQIKWCLQVEVATGSYEVMLQCFNDIPIKASIMIFFSDHQISCKTFTFQEQKFVKVFDGFQNEEWTIEGSNKQLIVPGSSLKISCKITFDPESSDKICHNKASQDFEKLLECGSMSDVTFDIDGKEIHAHKVILSSRSPVFQAMFEHDMMENRENVVKVEDISYEVMKELLRYIYASKVNGIEKIVVELLAAADKYCVSDLYILCERALIDGLKNLSVDNAVENLVLSSTYDVPRFKLEVTKFVILNLEDVMKTPQFNSLNLDILRNLLSVMSKLKFDMSSFV